MNEAGKIGMQCAECEVLMADVLDQQVSSAAEERFHAHLAQCANCSAMFADIRSGVTWLKSLEVAEPSPRLVHGILAATIGASPVPEAAEGRSWWKRLLPQPILAPVFSAIAQPRFALSFSMAFFSITLLLNLTGIKLSKMRQVDLRPSSLVRTYYEAQGRVARYYENLRFVYEIETRMRELQRRATPDAPSQAEPEKKPGNRQNRETSSSRPEQQENGQYSGEGAGSNLSQNTRLWFENRRMA